MKSYLKQSGLPKLPWATLFEFMWDAGLGLVFANPARAGVLGTASQCGIDCCDTLTFGLGLQSPEEFMNSLRIMFSRLPIVEGDHMPVVGFEDYVPCGYTLVRGRAFWGRGTIVVGHYINQAGMFMPPECIALCRKL